MQRELSWASLAFALAVGCGGGGDEGWERVSAPPSSTTLTDVWAFSETDVWFVDGGPVVHRYDGSSWSTLETPAAGVSCIFAISVEEVYLCAGGGLVRYDGASFTVIDVETPTGLSAITDVWASSANDVWAVGDDAIAAHYDGTTWSRHSIGASFNSSVWGSGPDDVYVLGTFDLVHYDGSAWTEVSLDSGAGDGQVWGTRASDVWVMTDSSSLAHYDGASWQSVETDGFVGDLAAVWGPSPDDLWAAGSAGAIAHWDGRSWSEVTHQTIGSPYLRMLVAVHGTSSTDVWAVGYQLGEGGSSAVIYHHGP
ncbi:MAG: hypothetical protein IT379_17145 [Deltaproteobacteria bacterium]|nr:hypothetical protein [Deltaproteobacteria bacterium]